ncbi:MAG: hypothetical protein ACD_8C00092G0003 [uncultured bacterium]|nr:MAG: hypothetical protein ACD_8C00092G0003 [uncultured bacterium]
MNKLIVFFLIVFSFLILVTGVIKLPEAQRYFLFAYDFVPAATLSKIHDFSGIVLLVLIIAHLIVKKEWLSKHFKAKLNVSEKMSKTFYLIIAGLLVVAVVGYVKMTYFSSHIVKNLSSVEVSEYKGEKLGSIDDFRENSIKGVQYIDQGSYQLEIGGLVSDSVKYSYDDILKLQAYQKVVTLNCVEGWSVKALWEGILVKDLLKNVNIKPEAKTIIFYAADGYSTSFPLEYVLKNDIIMADKLNGVTLPAERGFPFQLVAEQKWGYKWIKWITRIELSSDTNYKGFWESRGYNNNGDFGGSKFE